MSKTLFYNYPHSFALESGAVLPEFRIAYNVYGKMNHKCDNVVWVCHALTANSDVADWWPHTVEKDRFLDPDKWCVICANILGSPYGTTAPLHNNPATGEPYYGDFRTIQSEILLRPTVYLPTISEWDAYTRLSVVLWVDSRL